jgi:subtilase family serine protease
MGALGLQGIADLPSAPNGSLLFNWLHQYAPVDICAAYGVDRLHNEGWTGKGQTIVIIEGGYGSPTALQDLQTFSTTFGLPAPNLTIVYPGGQPTLNGFKLNDAGETSLDLQWAHAIAPDANLVLIVSNPSESDGNQGIPGVLKAVQYATTNYPGAPISQSFGTAEPSFHGAADGLLQTYDAVYQQAIAAGCTPLAAAGDWGSANPTKQGFGSANAPGAFSYQTVCWPASSPSVTAVGGTWLQYNWRWNPQTNFQTALAISYLLTGVKPSPYDPIIQALFNWDATGDSVEGVYQEEWWILFRGYGSATGGGLSAVFPTPWWQAGLPMSLTQGARAVPDLSWNAATDGSVLVYSTPGGGWDSYSGASCGTPQIAGLVAIANQMRAALGKGPVGHLAPKLYQLATSNYADNFNDIVPETFGSGTNAITLQDNRWYPYPVPGLPTTAGYDLTTGLGSPKAWHLVHDLANLP